MIIGLSGAQGAGKDTVAGTLVGLFGFHQIAFADPLRQAAAAMFGLTMEEMTDRELKDKPLGRGPWRHLSPRQLLKLLGTEAGRNIFHPLMDPTYEPASERGLWVSRLWQLAEGKASVVIPDVRFADEANSIKARGGLLVRVDRPDLEIKVDDHASEQEWQNLDFDAVLVNDAPNAMAFQSNVAYWWSNFQSRS